MGITRDIANKATTMRSIFADNAITPTEVSGLDDHVHTATKPVIDATATAMAIALGG